MLVDLGQAFPFSNPPESTDIGTPVMYRAPEAIFDGFYDVYSDIWALGCLLFEIRTGSPLFTSMFGGRDEIVQQTVQMKEKMPEPWWSAWGVRSRCFGESLKEWPDWRVMAVEYPIEEMIEAISDEDEDDSDRGPCAALLEPQWSLVPVSEAAEMKDFLERTLQYEQKKRLSVDEMLDHSWLIT